LKAKWQKEVGELMDELDSALRNARLIAEGNELHSHLLCMHENYCY
jgi:hypothetical protein